MRTLILGDGVAELVDGGRDLHALLEDSTLALDAHLEGPLDEVSHVSLLVEGAANAEGLGLLGEESLRALILPLGGGELLLGSLGGSTLGSRGRSLNSSSLGGLRGQRKMERIIKTPRWHQVRSRVGTKVITWLYLRIEGI